MTAAPETSVTYNPDAGPPPHRASAVACSEARPTAVPDGGFGLTTGRCSTDTDCAATDAGENGRCVVVPSIGYSVCTWDDCFTDSDCGDAGVCACRDAVSGGANVCVPADCRVDSDCGPPGLCSPSLAGCVPYIGVAGYYCHRPGDACLDDADCRVPYRCVFNATGARWTCALLDCSG